MESMHKMCMPNIPYSYIVLLIFNSIYSKTDDRSSQGFCMSHYKNKTSTTQRIYNFRKRTYLQKYSIHYTYIPRVAFISVYERTHNIRTIYQNQFAILYEVSIKYNLS